MRWPWQRRERRDCGDFYDAVVRLIEAQAAGTVAVARPVVRCHARLPVPG